MRLPVQVVLEMRFQSTPDGRIWSQTTCTYDFWRRYLEVFDEVVVIARVTQVRRQQAGAKRVDGTGVRFVALPYYIGLGPFFTTFPKIWHAMRCVNKRNGAMLYRIPSMLSELAVKCGNANHPIFGVEVVGDPYDVFGPKVIRHPLRPCLRWFFTRHVRELCRKATAVAYVNESVLRKRYPPNPSAFVSSYSSVELPADAFRGPQQRVDKRSRNKIVFVGSLAQAYKGADILIDAVGRCRKRGLDVEAAIVGDGRFKAGLAQQVHQVGLKKYVSFLGQLPAGEAVRLALDDGDLFVLPARTEGLPRVVIEAMARAKPCISTTVGGIPELLPPEDLVPPGDPEALANKIVEVLRNPGRMATMGARNYQTAGKYKKEILDRRRRLFYANLRSRTERWLKAKALL